MRTPGPWTVEYDLEQHVAGSPACDVNEVGFTETVMSPEYWTAQYERMNGTLKLWDGKARPAWHTRPSPTVVNDILGPSGEHVVCWGHDYDDYGGASVEDAKLIAAAPEMVEAIRYLIAEYEDLDERGASLGLENVAVGDAKRLLERIGE